MGYILGRKPAQKKRKPTRLVQGNFCPTLPCLSTPGCPNNSGPMVRINVFFLPTYKSGILEWNNPLIRENLWSTNLQDGPPGDLVSVVIGSPPCSYKPMISIMAMMLRGPTFPDPESRLINRLTLWILGWSSKKSKSTCHGLAENRLIGFVESGESMDH